MSKKYVYLIILIFFLGMIFLGGSIVDGNLEDNNYNSSFYVEETGNVFIKFGKLIDGCCFFIVDIVISGISSIFQAILGY